MYCSYGEDRWEIVFGNFGQAERRAVEMLYAGVSREVPYVLTAKRAGEKEEGNNHLLLVGTRASNPLIARCVKADEIPENGYLVRVTANAFDESRQMAVLAGSGETETIYAVVHFLSSYLPLARQNGNHVPYFRRLFSGKMKEYAFAARPAFHERGIWTWGHCIYDYRRMAANMARLGLNAITIWNDFAPLNLKEVVDCFHSYGIKVIFGYSWGWDEGVDVGSEAELDQWKERIVQMYADGYADAGGDGIYFQSFTETNEEYINGVLIADAVVHWANTVSAALWERWPDLKIQFGLHATSVRNRLDRIQKVDPRISILWEDCGAFPYAYLSRDTQGEESTLALTDAIAALRPGCEFGTVLKGQICLDWSRFEHQKGPFVLGCESPEKLHDALPAIRAQWHDVQSYWFKNIGQCRRVLQHLRGAPVYALVEGALLEYACWYPVALYAQLLWNPDESDEEVLSRVAQRTDVTLA